MDAIIILGAIAGAPVLVALLLRVNSVFLFLSAVAGNLFVQYISDDAELVAGIVIKGANVPTATRFALLFLPVVLTIFFMRKTMQKSKVLLHLLPLVATGLTIGVFALPLMASSAQDQIFASAYGDIIRDTQDVAVSAAAFLTLLLVWATYRHKEGKHGKKHK